MSARVARTRDPSAGFTLVEIVVAMGLLALILAMAGTALRMLARTAATGNATIERIDGLSRGLGAVRGDLERMLRAVRVHREQAEFVFSGDQRSMEFVVIEPPFPTEPGPYLVSYRVVKGQGASQLVRWRALYDASPKGSRELQDPSPTPVIEGPYDFKFSYFERKTGRDGWTQRWTDKRRMPELVRLEVLHAADGGPVTPPLIVRPRIDAEVGCTGARNDECTPRTGGALPDTKAEPRPDGRSDRGPDGRPGLVR